MSPRQHFHNYEKLGDNVYVILSLCVVLASIIGYIMNIAGIVHTINNPLTGMFIFRCIGIFAFPLGCILGYF